MKRFLWKYKGTWRDRLILASFLAAIMLFIGDLLISSCLADTQHQGQEGVIDVASSRRKAGSRVSSNSKDQQGVIDFTAMSLEELKQVTIITILKSPQKLSEATSAITVITQEDIRRSGAMSIPELLRDVPGLQVAQINSYSWAVSARGFNDRQANKLLVLIDGRSVYTPLFSGVYWNVQDTLLEDVERIEVIRGPGASLWGANAVNGVINIITKKAKDTQGGLVTMGLGDEDLRSGGVRYGGGFGTDVYSRMYVKYSERDKSKFTSGRDAKDSWESIRGGGRLDWSLSGADSLTLQGDLYEGINEDTMQVPSQPYSWDKKVTVNVEESFSGENLLCRWGHTFSGTSDMSLQFYYDRTEKDNKFGVFPGYKERFDTYDLDFQHSFSPGRRHDIVWGLGYRLISDRINMLLDPPSRRTNLFSAFFQDSFDIVGDKVRLTMGSKFEHNEYTGFEIQPGIRMLWRCSRNQNIWTSISRAVRTPSRLEYDRILNFGPPPHGHSPASPQDDSNQQSYPPPYEYDRRAKSEYLIAYEAGYRFQPEGPFSLDLAAFYNVYDNLILFNEVTAGAENYGIELAIGWRLLRWWSLRAAYTYLHMHISIDEMYIPQFHEWEKDFLPPDIALESTSPDHQISLRSSIDLMRDLDLEVDVRYVDNLLFYVKGYTEMDARIGWTPRDGLVFSVVGQNLLHGSHSEFFPQGQTPYWFGENIEIERSVCGKVTCQF